MIRLGQPWSLLVLLLFAFVVMRLRTFPRGSAVRRGAAWLCLAVALSGPEMLLGGSPEPTVLVVDVSASAARPLREAAGRLQDLVRRVSGGGPVGIVALGAKAYVVSPPTRGDGANETLRRLGRLAAEPETIIQAAERDETDVAAGLQLAAWALRGGHGGRVILATDGWETRGDARGAARDLAAAGIAVDVLPLHPLQHVRDASVEDVEAPGQVLRGSQFEVRATIRSTQAGQAKVFLLEQGSPVHSQDRQVSAGDTPVQFVIAADSQGERRYGIRVAMEGDQESRNDAAEVGVMVLGRPRVLWLGTNPGPLGTSTLEIVTATPDTLNNSFRRLNNFDSVVLANVPLDALPPGMPEGLRHYVGSLGGGLMMTGGTNSFGPGGYRGTAIEDVLPVELDPGARAGRPGLALVLALDKSGSMGEALGTLPKIAAAREAAMVIVSLLETGDRFGLLAFDSLPRRILPVQERPGAAELRAVLAQVEPGGGTLILPTLSEAARMLSPFQKWQRHVILVTDGRGEGGDFIDRAGQLAASGVGVSVIAVGHDADVDLLRALATAGGGRFEFALDAGKLSVALRRAVVSARRSVIHEGHSFVVATPHPVTRGLPKEHIPPLFGYVSTAPKPFAAVPLRTETGEAILALGSFGLGRAAALMTDLDGPWGANWRAWGDRPRLIADVLHWLLRAPTAGHVTMSQEASRDGWTLAVHLQDFDGNRLNGRVLVARLREESGRDELIRLEQRGPGAYSGTLTSRVAVPTSVIVEDRSEGQQRVGGQGWLGLSYSEEYRVRGPNHRLLEELRRVTGGRLLDTPEVEPVVRLTQPRRIPLAPWLASIALGVFLLELILQAPSAFRRRTARTREA